jgi:HAD superfamily hydrolase (TIGR01457 family)
VLADRYEAFLFDLDGVLYRGAQAVPGAAAAVRGLRTRGKAIAFVTNNSSATPHEVAGRLRRMGIQARAGEVETSALTTAEVLANRGMTSAFVIGEEGIRSALETAGVAVVDGEPDAVDAVVVGLDRGADYAKLCSAALLVQRGAALIATNPDTTYPAPDGSRWPGAGSLLAAVVAASGASPEIVGKPEPPIFRAALDRAGGGAALVIGDRLDTDIAGASRLGWDSLLVLTGIATPTELEASAVKPTYTGADLGVLFDTQR